MKGLLNSNKWQYFYLR